MGDRIADEHHFRIEPIFDAQHLPMPGTPVVAVLLQLRRRKQGGIARHVDRERLVPHELGQGWFDGLRPSLGASRARMQQVPHQLWVDSTVRLQEHIVHILPEDLFAVGQSGGELTSAAAGGDALRRRVEGWRAYALFSVTAAGKNP